MDKTTHRERVIKTLNHKQVDRIAIDLGGTPCSSAHVSIIDKLRKELKLYKEGDRIKVIEPYQILGEVTLQHGMDFS
jgi:hypothetical protein